MADNSSSGMTAIVAIIAIIAILVVGYFAFQMLNDKQPGGINVNIPAPTANE